MTIQTGITFNHVDNALFKAGRAAWSSASLSSVPSFVGSDSNLTTQNDPIESEQIWARMTSDHGISTLRGRSGSALLYQREGSFIVQIFTQKNMGIGDGNELAQFFVDSMEGTSYNLFDSSGAAIQGGRVSVLEMSVIRLPPEDRYFQTNVVATFTWLESK